MPSPDDSRWTHREVLERARRPAHEAEDDRAEARQRLLDALPAVLADFQAEPERVGWWLADLEAAGLADGHDREALYAATVALAGPDYAEQAFAGTTEGPAAAEIAASLRADFEAMVAAREQREREASLLGRVAGLVERLAGWLGLTGDEVRVRADEEAGRRTAQRGARGLVDEGVVWLSPQRWDPDTHQGRAVLAHELVHVAQREERQTRPGRPEADKGAAEREAASLGAAFADGARIGPPSQVLPARDRAADTDADKAAGQDGKPNEVAAKRPQTVTLRLAGFEVRATLPAEGGPARVVVPALGWSPLPGLSFSRAELTFDKQWKLRRGTLLGSLAVGPHLRADGLRLDIDRNGRAKALVKGVPLRIGRSIEGTLDVTVGAAGLTGRARIPAAKVNLGPGVEVSAGAIEVGLSPDGSLTLGGEVTGAVEHLGQVTVAARMAEGRLAGSVTASLGRPVELSPGVKATAGTLSGAWAPDEGFSASGTVTVDVGGWASAPLTAEYQHRGGRWRVAGRLEQVAPASFGELALSEGWAEVALGDAGLEKLGVGGKLTRGVVEVTLDGTLDGASGALGGGGVVRLVGEVPLGPTGAVLSAVEGEATVAASVLTSVAMTRAVATWTVPGGPALEAVATEMTWDTVADTFSGSATLAVTEAWTPLDCEYVRASIAPGVLGTVTLGRDGVTGDLHEVPLSLSFPVIDQVLAVALPDSVVELVTGHLSLTADGLLALAVPWLPVRTGAVAGQLDVSWDPVGGLVMNGGEMNLGLPWGGQVAIESLALEGGQLTGAATFPVPALPGLAFDGEANFQARVTNGEVVATAGPLAWRSEVVPGLTGTARLEWSSGEGLKAESDARLVMGERTIELSLSDVSWDLEGGLSGTAALRLEDLGIDWLASPCVELVIGEAAVRFERGALVGGGADVEVALTFGKATLQLTGLGAEGPEADVSLSVTSLGETVTLADPVTITGRHSGGKTTLQADGCAWSVPLGSELFRLNGRLGPTTLDGAGLTSSATLELFAGPLGFATASAEILEGRLQRAELGFMEPVFQYPVDRPIIRGQFTGAALAYEEGRFSGSVSGKADFDLDGLAREDAAPGGLVFQLDALPEGGLSGAISGWDINAGPLVIDFFELNLMGDDVSATVEVSPRADLPFEAQGEIQGGWGEQGLTLSGAFDVASKKDANPAWSGNVKVGYAPQTGLTAKGAAEITLDSALGAKAKAELEYSAGRLVLSASGGTVLEKDEPIFSMSKQLGGRKKILPGLKVRDAKERAFPLGVPYFNGVTIKLGVFLPAFDMGGSLHGLVVQGRVPGFDVLAGERPSVHVDSTLKSDLYLGGQSGVRGIIDGHLYGVTLGVQADALVTVGMGLIDPRITANHMRWSPEGELSGQLGLTLPFAVIIKPQLFIAPRAGFMKWAAGVPGLKKEVKLDPVKLDLFDPLDLSFSWEFLTGKTADPLQDLGLGDLNLDTLKQGIIDPNPELKKLLTYMVMAYDVVAEVLGDVEAQVDSGLRFWESLFDGDSLDSAVRKSHDVERLTTESQEYLRLIGRQHKNLQALLEGGPDRLDEGLYARTLEQLTQSLLFLNLNWGTLASEHLIFQDGDVRQRYKDAYQAARRRLTELPK